MKSLVIKTLLVVSAVALTGALAWSKTNDDRNLGQGLNRGSVTEAASPQAENPSGYCAKCHQAEVEGRLLDKTTAPTSTQKSEGSPSFNQDNAESSNQGG